MVRTHFIEPASGLENDVWVYHVDGYIIHIGKAETCAAIMQEDLNFTNQTVVFDAQKEFNTLNSYLSNVLTDLYTKIECLEKQIADIF